MYIPKHFEQSDWQSALGLIEQASFAQLITVDAQNSLQVSYLPVLYDAATEAFIFHLAKANPHSDLLETADSTIIFNGPHGYISPTWSEDIIVPTWNYTTVHIQGRVQEVVSHNDKLSLMTTMVDFYESVSTEPWQISELTPVQEKGMFKAIRCFRLSVDSWQAKYKLSQNRSSEAVEQLSAKLLDIAKSSEAGENDKALANLMLNP